MAAAGARRSTRSSGYFNHDGEGRAPIGNAVVMERDPKLPPSPNWAPAFAGVELEKVFVVLENACLK